MPTRDRFPILSIPLYALVFALTLYPAAAEPTGAPKTPSEIREELIPLYADLKNDPQFRALEDQLAGNMDNREVVDRYLAYMPISPLEFVEIDMNARRYEVSIPRHLYEWHARWIGLHEETARALYGDRYVDAKLAAWPVDTSRGVDSARALVERTATVGTNRNAGATWTPAPDHYQGEVQVVVNHNNPNQIVAGTNTWDSLGGLCGNGIQGVFYSSDGGTTWGYTCAPDETAYGLDCPGRTFGSDPALDWNDNNEVFLNHMLLCNIGTRFDYAMVVARSADGGATWSGQAIIANSWGTPDFEDKNFYIIDNHTESPFYGRHYLCWDRTNDQKAAYSTDNGASWKETDLPNPPGTTYDIGCDLAIDDNGTVHIVFDTLSCGAFYCNREWMYHTRSTDGGNTWSELVMIRKVHMASFSKKSFPEAQDNRGLGPLGAIDIDNTGGACDGVLYLAFADTASPSEPGDAADIWLVRSTDGGNTWSEQIKVNDDGLAGRIQFNPYLVVDPSNGQVVVAWHDARNDPANRAIDTFVARSIDCGRTFEANIQVTRPSPEFNNSGISHTNLNTADNPNRNPNQHADYLGLDARDCKAYVAWTDSRTYFPSFSTDPQRENPGFAIVDFGCGSSPASEAELAEPGT